MRRTFLALIVALLTAPSARAQTQSVTLRDTTGTATGTQTNPIMVDQVNGFNLQYQASDLLSNVTGNTTGSLQGIAYGSAILTVTCTSCAGGTTVSWEGTADGGFHWFALQARQVGIAIAAPVYATSTTTAGVTYWAIDTFGLQGIRGRVTSYSAGTISVTGNSNQATGSGSVFVANGTASFPLQVSLANTSSNSTAVKVDGSAVTQPVSGTFWQATQPVSGTVTANAGTNLNTSALALDATVTGRFPAGASPADNESNTNANLSRLGAFNFVFDGTTWDRWTGAVSQSGTWNVTNISGTVSLPTGASTLAEQQTQTTALQLIDNLPNTQGSTTSGQSGALALGAVTTAAPTYTTAQSNALSLTTTGLLRTDGSGVTQPVSASSLPLPSLAATSTKQSDGTQKTQIVDGSGNVIASTSNNLNVQCANCSGSGASAVDAATFTASSSVFAPGGGFFQTTATNNALTTGQQGMWQMTANRAGFVNLRNASGTEIGTSTTPVQVSLANTASNATAVKVDGSAVTQPVSGTVSITANSAVNVAQLAGTATSVNSGSKDAGTLRVVLATDQPALTNKLLVTPDSVALPANQSVNTAQFGGTNVSTGTGTGGAGIPRVTVSSDSSITANAGTNLNTSALALEATQVTGNASLAAIATSVAASDVDTSLIDSDLRGTSGTDTTLLALLRELRRQGTAFGANATGLRGSFGTAIGSTGNALNTVQTQPSPSFDPCLGPTKAAGAISQTANAVVISTPGREIVVCHVFVQVADAENLSLVYGTGTTCGTGTTAMIGGTTAANGPNGAANGGWVVGNGAAWIARAPAGNDVCLLQSGSGRVAGNLTYALR